MAARHEDVRVFRGPQRHEREVEMPEALPLGRDRVRWGPIWAGLVTALTTTIMLALLGAGIGLAGANDAAAANMATASGIWAAISAIVAFGVGGFVAGRMGAVYDRRWGAWNGALVFMTAIPISALLASAGLAAIAGALDVTTITGGATGANLANAVGAAWVSLIGLIVGLGAAALGGALGTRTTIDMERVRPSVETDR